MNNFILNINSLKYTEESVSIDKFSLSVAGKTLFQDSPLVISPGNIYGLIGKNGAGKSSLLKQLGLTNLFSDNKINVLYVEQELEMDDSTPAEFIFKSNIKLCELNKQIEDLENQMENYEETSNISFEELKVRFCSPDQPTSSS